MNEDEMHGHADLLIGEDVGKNKNANREIGDPGPSKLSSAIRENGDPGGGYWHSRGYLPHFESKEKLQHVSFHLADSLPKSVLEQLEEEYKNLPSEKQAVEKRKIVEAWVDAGHGSCVLQESEIARMVQNTLLYFDGQRYRLLAWVIMPNHVHVLFQPLNGWTVAKIVASWKKYTARKICDYRRANCANQEIGVPGEVWHREYWDRYMRDERHLQQAIEYIHQNPVKASLVRRAEDWPWSSAGRVSGRVTGRADLPIGEAENVQIANQEIGVPEIGDPGGKA
jgi:type I restriction enzyme R subunit/putative DNA methylase